MLRSLPPSGTVTTVSATIPEGESLSNAVDLTAGRLIRIVMPDDWTPAVLSFLIAGSIDEAEFRPLVVAMQSDEFTVPCHANRCVVLEDDIYAYGLWGAFVKIRSGRSGRPVPQAADRLFKLHVVMN